MLHHVIIWLKKLRRVFSRPEWVVRLLALTRSPQTATKPGLILVQIDGLSRTQFEAALAAERLPLSAQKDAERVPVAFPLFRASIQYTGRAG